uniref:TPM domain-containing protein n=1 Tax=Parascaris univalens TaxID=6257 RepID=A0A915CJL7_PARUN
MAFHWWSLWPLIFVLNYSLCQRIEWDAGNFPNPTIGDFKRCNMKTTASICDPDAILTEQQRYRLNHELHQLESRTRQDHAPDFCQKKGITAAMAIAKHVRGGSEQAVRDMANQMLRKWSLDDQCQKSVVIVVAIEDKRFWVARSPRVPVYAAEFNQIFADQKSAFERGDYAQALGNIVQQIWEKALAKQGPRGGGNGGSSGRSGYDGGERGHGGRSGETGGGGVHQPGFKVPSVPRIPIWVWLAIICVIIPLLCCCCLCYCCFCRKRGASSSARRQMPSDIERGDGMGGGSGVGQRGRGGGLSS